MVGKPDRKPEALRVGRGVQQGLEGVKGGFTQAVKCFSQIQTFPTSRSSRSSASFQTVFKDVAQGKPGPEAGLELGTRN